MVSLAAVAWLLRYGSSEFEKRSSGMLRISESNSSEKAATLRLEGQMIGQWVGAVEKVCEQYLASDRKLTLDLAEVLFVDRSGIVLLQELMRRGVRLAFCSPFLTEQLKEVILLEG
jgi:ABC-type transporter Mla MlaB component